MSLCLKSLAAARRWQIPQQKAQAWLAASDAKFFYCIAPLPAIGDHAAPRWHARMQFYSGEDPATGSVAGSCIAWLVQHSLAASGEPTVIEQGLEILRPSRIVASALRASTGVQMVTISGRTIPVADGRFFRP